MSAHWDEWTEIVSYGGPFSLLPPQHRKLAAARRIQYHVRAFLERMPVMAVGNELLVLHQDRWKLGTLFHIHDMWVIQIKSSRMHYVFLNKGDTWKLRKTNVRIADT